MKLIESATSAKKIPISFIKTSAVMLKNNARVGAVISKNRDLMQGILKLAQGRLCCPTLEQIGAAALYRLDKSYYDEAKAEYCARRDAAYAAPF